MIIPGKQYYEINFGPDEEVFFGEANVIKPIEAELVGCYYRGTKILLAVSPACEIKLLSKGESLKYTYSNMMLNWSIKMIHKPTFISGILQS